jgi:deoxyribodipyrimidine photolyase
MRPVSTAPVRCVGLQPSNRYQMIKRSSKHRTLAVLVLTLFGLTAAAQEGPREIAVYVFAKTDPSGFSDVNQQQRAQAVEDLHRELRKKHFLIVSEPGQAEIRLEVLGSQRKETGTLNTTASNVGLGMTVATTQKEKKPTVHVELRVAEYSLEIDGTAKRSNWAAEAVAKHVEKWAKDNRAVLEQRRVAREHR